MNRLAESRGGDLYPARGELGGINRKLMSILGFILISRNTYLVIYQVLESNEKILETLED